MGPIIMTQTACDDPTLTANVSLDFSLIKVKMMSQQQLSSVNTQLALNFKSLQ